MDRELLERLVVAFEKIAHVADWIKDVGLEVHNAGLSVTLSGTGAADGHNLCLDLSAPLDNIANAIRDASSR